MKTPRKQTTENHIKEIRRNTSRLGFSRENLEKSHNK